MTRTTPLRRMILQFSQIRLTLLRTFIRITSGPERRVPYRRPHAGGFPSPPSSRGTFADRSIALPSYFRTMIRPRLRSYGEISKVT